MAAIFLWLVSLRGFAIMRYWDKSQGKTLHIFRGNRFRGNEGCRCQMLLMLGATALLGAACDAPEPIVTNSAATETPVTACGQDGRLAVELYGSIRASIDWQPGNLACTGMPRPEGEGARVRMSGPFGSGADVRTLAFILGLPDLEMGQTGKELPTNVTLIEEGTGRFFATADTNGCWTDVTDHDPTGDEGDRTYRIEGTLYCVSPLAELNGNTSVTFTEMKFTGRLDWDQPR
jgi:hypothetical protein